MGGKLPTVRTYINDFLKRKLDNFLHKTQNMRRKYNVKYFRRSVSVKSCLEFVSWQRTELRKLIFIIRNYVIVECILETPKMNEI